MKLLFSAFLGLMLIGCADNSIDTIADSQEYANMKAEMQQIIDWAQTVDNQEGAVNLDIVVFQVVNGCDPTGGTDDPNSHIDPPAYREFVQGLDFRTTMELHNHFVAYGRNIFDLKVDHRPDDIEQFSNEISELMIVDMNISACKAQHVKRLNYSAYKKAFTHGVTVVGADATAPCSGDCLYGNESSIAQLVRYMKAHNDCSI